MIAKLVTIASDIGELTADKLEEFKREKFPKIKDSVASAVKYILLLIFVSIAHQYWHLRKNRLVYIHRWIIASSYLGIRLCYC